MAYPTDIHVVAPSGVVRCGRPAPPAYGTLLNQIAAATPGTWFKANQNSYQSAWPNDAYLPLFGAGPSKPSKVIIAWSSFAWDDTNMRAILFGGGHANAADGEVYTWNGDDRQWELAFHSTEIENVAAGWRSVAGSLNSPVSAHTYANQTWLPKQQRFLTFGGAQHSSGAAWVHSDAAGNALRTAGPFTLDMTLAGQGYVSASTGSNVKRVGTVSEGVSLPGANAWSNRDWFLDHPQAALLAQAASHVNGGCATVIENDHDVVYFTGRASTSHNLFRVEIVDSDYHNDIITKVGTAWSNSSGPGGAAYAPTRKLFLHPSFIPNSVEVLGGWDLNTAGENNKFFRVATSGLVGGGAAEFSASISTAHGILWDERRDHFVVWGKGGLLWSVKPPPIGADVTTGWEITKIVTDDVSPRPALAAELLATETDTGVHGKWKRSDALDVYIGLQNSMNGNIWIFKPLDWLDPRR